MRINSIGAVRGVTAPKNNNKQDAKSPAFQKLLDKKFLEKFNPECSESSYAVWKIFNDDSWAIYNLLKNFDVKVVFTNKWFTTHPLYRKTHDYMKPIASYAQMDLFFKRPDVEEEKDGVMTKEVWKKISIGEYSNYGEGIRLSEAELKLAYTIKKMPYETLMSLARPLDSDYVYTTPLNTYDHEDLL